MVRECHAHLPKPISAGKAQARRKLPQVLLLVGEDEQYVVATTR